MAHVEWTKLDHMPREDIQFLGAFNLFNYFGEKRGIELRLSVSGHKISKIAQQIIKHSYVLLDILVCFLELKS